MTNQGVKSIAINAAYLVIAKVVASGARVIYAIALAKLLGPELYGMFNLGMSWYLLFLPISLLGLDAILVREVGRDRANAEQLLGHTLAMRTASSVLTALASFFIGFFLESDPTAKMLLFIFSIALLGRGLSLWVYAIFRAYEESQHVFRQEAGFRLLEVVLGMAVLLNGGGVVSVASVHTVIWVLQGLMGLYFVRKHIVTVTSLWQAGPIFGLLRQGLPFVIGAFLLAWVMQGGVLIYRSQAGYTADLGMLALAMQALIILGGIVTQFSNAALPVLSRSVHRDDGKSRFFIDIILRSGFLLGGVLSIAGIAVGPVLIEWVLGAAYHEVAELLPWTLFWIAPYFIMMSMNSVIIALGSYNWIALVNLVGASVFTVLVIPLHQAFGTLGIVWALGAGLFSANLAQLFVLRRSFHVDISRAVVRPLVAVLASLFVCKHLPGMEAWILLVVGLSILIVLTLLIGVIRKEELLFMAGLVKSRL